MRILTAAEMREADRRAIEELGVPSLVLMENAALGVVDAVAELLPEVERVAIFCGPGNNGGDGLAVARQLATRGYRVETWLAVDEDRLKGDAAIQLAICRRLGLAISVLGEEETEAELLAATADAELVIDALFGTGLSRPLEGSMARLVEGINRHPAPVLAVDLPSGLDAGREEPIGPAVKADLTVTFAAPKLAHVFSPAADFAGEVVVTDLGLPLQAIEGSTTGGLHLLTDEEVAVALEPRAAASHKGSFGHLLVVAGSRGKSGAAVLACRAALRAGAGLVTAAVAGRVLESVAAGCAEAMTLPLADSANGELEEAAADEVVQAAAERSALAVGPGIGTAPKAAAAVRRIVCECELPLVLDADGLNALLPRNGGEGLEELTARSAPTVLTPHPGELARLLDCTTAEIERDRRQAAGAAAERSGCVVVLKGHQSLIATPEQELHVNPTGNAGMATAGCGDVLTGILGALLGQGLGALDAARVGVFVHGLAGDLAAFGNGGEEGRGEVGLIAGDLVEALPAAFRRLAAARSGSG